MLSRYSSIWIFMLVVGVVASAGCGSKSRKSPESEQPAITGISITPQFPSILTSRPQQLKSSSELCERKHNGLLPRRRMDEQRACRCHRGWSGASDLPRVQEVPWSQRSQEELPQGPP